MAREAVAGGDGAGTYPDDVGNCNALIDGVALSGGENLQRAATPQPPVDDVVLLADVVDGAGEAAGGFSGTIVDGDHRAFIVEGDAEIISSNPVCIEGYSTKEHQRTLYLDRCQSSEDGGFDAATIIRKVDLGSRA